MYWAIRTTSWAAWAARPCCWTRPRASTWPPRASSPGCGCSMWAAVPETSRFSPRS
ncbi:hypothetical protein MMEU_3657 [Mycobacterium marinum str. Europe]|nr:hypothetical protein MMEU_3657 [Mycobacterium marinum str. Europe]